MIGPMVQQPQRGESVSAPQVGRVAVVVSRYNRWITDRLEEGAKEEHARLTGGAGSLQMLEAPGSFELPVIALAAARSGRFDAVVCLGCIIRGETTHDRHIATAVAQGIAQVSIETGVPVAFGVLTVENAEQAEARAGGAMGNKGAEAMAAALATASVIAQVRAPAHAGKEGGVCGHTA